MASKFRVCRRTVLAGVGAIILASSGCSKFASAPESVTGDAKLDRTCGFFGPHQSPADSIAAFSKPLPDIDKKGTDPAPNGTNPLGTDASLIALAGKGLHLDPTSGIEQDVDAFNKALERIINGEDPAKVAAEYRPTGEAFGKTLAPLCEKAWVNKP